MAPHQHARREHDDAVSVLSAIGFLSAKFILPEMWGYVEQEEAAATKAALDESPTRSR